jgi:hypothetical protein
MTTMWYRIAYFIILTIVGVFITPIISLPMVVYYALRWYALELLLIGYVFDTYFGRVADWPYYTLSMAALIFLAELAKRYLMFKDETN